MGRFVIWMLTLLGAAPGLAQARRDLVLSGHERNNTVLVRAAGTDSGTYSIDGGRRHSFSGIGRLTINGHGGHDVCRVINPPGGLLAPPGGIDCNGDNGAGQPRRGVLELVGGRAASGSYHPGRAAGTGSLHHRLGRIRQVVHFTGLAPVTDTIPTSAFTITDGQTTSDLLALVSAGTAAGTWTVESLSNPAAIESDTFANKQAVTVTATSAPSTTILVAPTAPETALTSLTVHTNGPIVLAEANTGAVPVSLTAGTTVTGAGAGTDLTAGGLAVSAPAGIGPLTTDVSSIAAAATGGAVSIANAGSAGLGSVPGESLSGIMAGGDVSLGARTAGASLSASGAISGRQVALTADRLSLAGGSVTAIDQATISPASSGAGMNLGANTTNPGDVSAASLGAIHAPSLAIGSPSTGAITVSAPVSRPGGALTLIGPAGFGATGGGSLSAQALTLDDVGASGRPWKIGPSSIADGVAGAIPYSGVAALEVDGGSGSDTFDVTPSASTTDQIGGGGPSALPGDSLRYEAGGRTVTGAVLPPAGELDPAGVHEVGYAGMERVTVVGAKAPGSPPPHCSLFVTSSKITIARSHRGASLGVLAACDQAARGRLTGTVKIAAGKHSKKRALAVRAVSASLRSGTIARLNVKLPGAAVPAPRAGARESLTLTLTATSAGGTAHARATVRKLAR